MDKKKKLLTRHEAADYLGTNMQTISNWVNKKVLKGHYVKSIVNGNEVVRLYVNSESIDRYFDTLEDIAESERNMVKYNEEIKRQVKESEAELKELRKRILPQSISGRLVVSDVFKKILEVSGTLCERELNVLSDFIDGRNLEYIHYKYGLTKERCRQIAFKAIRRFGNVETWNNQRKEISDLQFKLSQYQKLLDEAEKRIDEYAVELDFKEKRDEEKRDAKAPLTDEEKNLVEILLTKLSYCNLSIRCLKCLKYCDVETIFDAISHDSRYYLMQRNFGRKSLSELEDLLDSMNLSFNTAEKYEKLIRKYSMIYAQLDKQNPKLLLRT